MSTHFNGLTPEQLEALSILSEELGEVQQAIGKILRHGLSSVDPTLPVEKRLTNAVTLGIELGDVVCAMDIVGDVGIVDRRVIDDRRKEKRERIGKYLHHVKVSPVKDEANTFNGVFISGGNTRTTVDLEALRASWTLPSNTSVKESFPISTQSIPVTASNEKQLRSDLNIIRLACREEGYGLDAVGRIEKILMQPTARSQLVWAKKEEIARARVLGGSFNVWYQQYADLDTALLLPPSDTIKPEQSRTSKWDVQFPPPM